MGTDASELVKLSADLGKGVSRAKASVAVRSSAGDIKDAMRADASGHRHFPHFPGTITYDMLEPLTAEIGPERRGQGRLAGIAYFGGRNGGGGMLTDPQDIADGQAKKFEKAIEDLAVEDLA